MMYAMLIDPWFSFNYFNREMHDAEGNEWAMMNSQLDYEMGRLLNDRILISCGRSTGKCGTIYSTIMNSNGTYVQLGTLIGKNFKIQTFDETNNELKWTNASAEANGTKPCLKITLDGNFDNEVTLEHPFLTTDGWVEAKDLKVGQYTVQPEYLPIHPNIDDSPSDEELKLIGYLLGDGCITQCTHFSNFNSRIVNEMRNIVKKFGCQLKRHSKKMNRKGSFNIVKKLGTKNNIKELLRDLELYGTTSHTKFIPDRYLKCSNAKLAILINRLFACDGWYSNNRIGYCTVSLKMMKQIQLILLRFGIRATYVEKRVKYKGGINLAYQMNISKNQVVRFFTQIGIFTKLYVDNMLTHDDCSDRAKLIPLTDELYNDLKSQQKLTDRALEAENCRVRSSYDTIDVNKLRRYLIFNDIPIAKYEYLWKNVTWVKIKSIKAIGEHPTVAITVPETSTHIIQGILSHNTSSIEHTIFKHAITHPNTTTGYVVYQEKHCRGLIQNLMNYFNRDEFTRSFGARYNQKDRIFTLANGHKIEIRILGHDKTGSVSLVALHCTLLILDEAQLLPRGILGELLPTGMRGVEIIVAGVPNDIRDSMLYYYCTRTDVIYYKYTSMESADWDERKEREFMEVYGGKHSVLWRLLVMACLTPDQLILTKRGMIPINEIKIGDLVLTHLHEWHKVTRLFEFDHDDDIYVIKVAYDNHPLKVTGNHPIMVSKRSYKYEKGKQIKHMSEFKLLLPEELKKGDTIQLATINNLESITHIDDYKLTNLFMYALGLYIAEGCINNRYVRYSLNKTEMSYVETLNKFFKIKPLIYQYKNCNGMTISYNDKDFIKFINKYAYGKSDVKYCRFDIYNVPKPLILEYIRGLYDGDGCFHVRRQKEYHYSYRTVSLNLAYQLRLLLRQFNINASITESENYKTLKDNSRIKYNNVFNVDLYGIEAVKLYNLLNDEKLVYNAKIHKTSTIENGSTILDITKEHYNGKVYDITVEHAHTLTVRDFITSNCWGDSVEAVFTSTKLIEHMKKFDFKYYQYNGERWADMSRSIELPPIKSKYKYYIIGGDMGYTKRSPLHICVLGAYDAKHVVDDETKILEDYDVVYRLQIAGMTSYDVAKAVDFLMDYFNCKHGCIDAQNVGVDVYSDLRNPEIFPDTFRRNEQFIIPLMFNTYILKGVIKTVNQQTGEDVEEEILHAAKVITTIKLSDLIDEGRFHIAVADQGADDFVDLITIMQAETQTTKTNKFNPKTYTNSVNQHCFVSGTKITTLRGDINIELVTTNDYVLTRYGYQKVLKSWLTRKNVKVFTYKINDIKLTCTPEHRILINGKFNSIDTLKIGDIVTTKVHQSIVNTLIKSNSRYSDVYNLTIDTHHEYYANTLLVANCTDALRCCAFVIHQVIERGMYNGRVNLAPVRPIKLTNGPFGGTKQNRFNKLISKRGRHER